MSRILGTYQKGPLFLILRSENCILIVCFFTHLVYTKGAGGKTADGKTPHSGKV